MQGKVPKESARGKYPGKKEPGKESAREKSTFGKKGPGKVPEKKIIAPEKNAWEKHCRGNKVSGEKSAG